ncbi:MAG: PIG-L family deacetylase [Chloroflexi bacterium]|nr:PIG-L family deacetylase [Chloroflexota bacterium]
MDAPLADTPDDDQAHLFVSPHFDDGVFSCGGRIHQLTRAGEPVTVITMMGGLHSGELPKSPILDDLHKRWMAGADPLCARQQEDKRALALLNAEHIHIDLTDCVYRQVDGLPLYPSEESLFGNVHVADYALQYLEALSLPDTARRLVIYLPLAVGHHVDHQIVRDWGIGLLRDKPESWSLRFYAEYPYFNTERAITLALSKMNMPLREKPIKLDEADLAAKVNAIACYNSQISTFWEDVDAMALDLRRSSLDPRTGQLVERYWEIES